MKINYILILVSIAFVLASCGEEKEPVKTETPVEETVVLQEVIEEPIAEEVIEVVPPQPKKVVVQNGEWLYDIARDHYGDFHDWEKIYEANKDKISDPNIIYPGMELVLPE
ncbi:MULTISPECIES: LysM peptidoglycan-binding domain-containing protein [unclassified Lentimicrobium]|uniref:LysM peptidoglycan-binding domain-containing protein n=1 Tax=unclassified Lentimicrobium TaxID=2677434 RepID=UPI00155450BA|nr:MULTISPECIES: LysM peptidoglycan-binding domain-containing protein [unclassified Lentimicrobium]NPD46981.1 LysM peptidoglycan-binding domain-containing protein [Lentimicrobium sp. S6]NPD83926.1 LysM peptidoglycan-binding domain-containing protein [Lentimicrobium sp. L6]